MRVHAAGFEPANPSSAPLGIRVPNTERTNCNAASNRAAAHRLARCWWRRPGLAPGFSVCDTDVRLLDDRPVLLRVIRNLSLFSRRWRFVTAGACYEGCASRPRLHRSDEPLASFSRIIALASP